MDILVSYYSAKGARPHNEDAVVLQESHNGFLAVVADGLGGFAKGRMASAMAASVIGSALQNKTPSKAALAEAVRRADDEIRSAQDEQHPIKTTVAALWLGDGHALTATVGNSRIYQFRDRRIVFQSVDHSVAQMAVLVGELDKGDIRTSCDRNRLIRVLGGRRMPKVDCETLPVENGDRFLLCSDGFWEPVTEDMMLCAWNRTASAKDWLEEMRQIVETRYDPKQDNHSAVALTVNS